jgi:protein-disulfide isomerase
MVQVAIVAVAALVALGVGWYMQQQRPDAPSTPTTHVVPEQLDRADFVRPDAPWLTVVFTSATCATCAKVWDATQLLESDEVATQNVEVVDRKDLHDRYGVTAVPMVVIADESGVTRASFLGPPSTADLWAKLAELRT